MGVGLIKSIDKFIGTPLCLLLGAFRQKKLYDSPKKILVMQLWGIGETILTLPTIKELSRRGSIDIACTERNKDVYFNQPHINKINILRLNPLSIMRYMIKNRKSYDLVVDMEEYLNISALMSFFLGKSTIGYSHGIRSRLYTRKVAYVDSQHASQTSMDLLSPLGIKKKVTTLDKLRYTKEDKTLVDKNLKRLGITAPFMVIAPGAAESSRSRIWPYFSALIEEIVSKRNAQVLLIGAQNEKSLCSSIYEKLPEKAKRKTLNLAGEFTLRQTFYLISKCSIMIGNDSGPMHIGAAMNIKTIGLFGPNLPVRFKPLNNKSIALYKKVTCSPCINVHKGQVPECKYIGTDDYQKCMKKIEAKDVTDLI